MWAYFPAGWKESPLYIMHAEPLHLHLNLPRSMPRYNRRHDMQPYADRRSPALSRDKVSQPSTIVVGCHSCRGSAEVAPTAGHLKVPPPPASADTHVPRVVPHELGQNARCSATPSRSSSFSLSPAHPGSGRIHKPGGLELVRCVSPRYYYFPADRWESADYRSSERMGTQLPPSLSMISPHRQ